MVFEIFVWCERPKVVPSSSLMEPSEEGFNVEEEEEGGEGISL